MFTDETLYPAVGKLKEGVMLLKWNSIVPSMQVDGWMLQGLPVIESNYSQDYPSPLPLNLTWFTFPNYIDDSLTIQLPPGINKAEVPSYNSEYISLLK